MEKKTNNTPDTKTNPANDMDVLAQAMELVKAGKADQLAAAIQHVQNQEQMQKPSGDPALQEIFSTIMASNPGKIIIHCPDSNPDEIPEPIRKFMESMPGKVVACGTISVPAPIAHMMGDLPNEDEEDEPGCPGCSGCQGCHSPCQGCHSPHADDEDDDEDCDDDDEDDDYDDDPESEVNIYDLLHSAGIKHINDTMIAMPTAYGRLLMMHPSEPADVVVNYICGSAVSTPAWNLCTVTIEGDKIVFDPEKDGDWIILLADSEDLNDRYVFPIMVDDIKNDHSLGNAAFSSMGDVLVAATSMHNAGLIDFELPHLAYKITKPGMKCKEQEYAMGELFTFDGEPILHKQGFHFADNKAALYGWYPIFNSENEVYRVQVSDVAAIENGVGVAGSILFTEKVDWTDIR